MSTWSIDPYAALAWTACLVNLALQKLLNEVSLDREEGEAIVDLHETAETLAQLAVLPAHDPRRLNPPRLTLSIVASRCKDKVDLGELERALSHIKRTISEPSVRVESSLLMQTQTHVCGLQETLNALRSQPKRSPHLEYVD
jgi:hypothetical protein